MQRNKWRMESSQNEIRIRWFVFTFWEFFSCSSFECINRKKKMFAFIKTKVNQNVMWIFSSINFIHFHIQLSDVKLLLISAFHRVERNVCSFLIPFSKWIVKRVSFSEQQKIIHLNKRKEENILWNASFCTARFVLFRLFRQWKMQFSFFSRTNVNELDHFTHLFCFDSAQTKEMNKCSLRLF